MSEESLGLARRPSFLSLTPEGCDQWIASRGFAKFRAEQLRQWLFQKRATSVGEMMNMPSDVRLALAEDFDWSLPEVIEALTSDDGATKLLLKTDKGHRIESVILRYDDRVSLCVSSQVGCKLACSFCQTGKLGFVSHLSREQIIAQYILAARMVALEGRRLSHVVFMGMGEPFDNYDHAVSAANAMIDIYGLSARHVTLSTSGIVPRIKTLAQDSRAALAVSLHASRDDLRTELMPINRKYDLAELKSALMEFQSDRSRKITIEYIMIKDKNCSIREAKELVRFLQGLRAKVNLIPFNAHPGLPYERPSDDAIRAFQKHLAERSIPAPVRYSRGLGVSAACGQLAAKNLASLHQQPARVSLLDPR